MPHSCVTNSKEKKNQMTNITYSGGDGCSHDLEPNEDEGLQHYINLFSVKQTEMEDASMVTFSNNSL